MDSYIGLLVLVGMIGAAVSESKYCPPELDNSPCGCYHGLFYGGNGTRVQCSFINDTQTLYNAVQKFRGYPVDYFILFYSNLTYLPPGLFSGTSVKRLYFQGANLNNLYSVNVSKPSPFDGLESSLQEIYIEWSGNLSQWYWPDMKNFTHLKSFQVNLAPFDFFGHVFAEMGGGSLETISVTFSKMYRIHPQAFRELTNLRSVVFNGNNIPYLVRTMFPNPAPKLEVLSFNYNKLFTLNENMFENMPALRYVDFSYNLFKTFENNVYNPLWNQLTTFYIAGNPFKCDCSLIPLQDKLISGAFSPFTDLNQVTCKSPGEPERKLKDLDRKAMHC